MAVVEPADVARELDDGRLHAEADAEERQAAFARFANRLDHAFYSAHPEPTGHQQTIGTREHVTRAPRAHEVLARHPLDLDADVVGDAAVDERLLHALVAVGIVGVLA